MCVEQRLALGYQLMLAFFPFPFITKDVFHVLG